MMRVMMMMLRNLSQVTGHRSQVTLEKVGEDWGRLERVGEG